eukprot:6350778-Lingulodinium_polyedra.AAC.1
MGAASTVRVRGASVQLRSDVPLPPALAPARGCHRPAIAVRRNWNDEDRGGRRVSSGPSARG